MPAQHGFISPGCSCETALAVAVHTICAHLGSRTSCELVQPDFFEAFDCLNHHILRKKLAKAGIRGKLSFVVGRTQTVLFYGAQSLPCIVLAGVPQGSILGPTLFAIFNDIVGPLKSTAIRYADDMSLIQHLHSSEDYSSLQLDITKCYNWSIENHLPLNLKKCLAMTIDSTNKLCTDLPELGVGPSTLSRASHTVLLGITLDH